MPSARGHKQYVNIDTYLEGFNYQSDPKEEKVIKEQINFYKEQKRSSAKNSKVVTK